MNSGLRRRLTAAGPLLMLIGVFIGMRLLVGANYWSYFNLHSILAQTVIVATGAIGMTLIIVGGGIDLSCGSAVALSSVCAALVLSTGLPDWIAVPAAIGTGVAVGLVNGSLVAGARLAPFIVTLGTMSICRGLAKWLADEQAVNYGGDSLIDGVMRRPPLPKGDASWHAWLHLSPAMWLLLGLALVVGLVLTRSTFGRRITAIGSNEAAARLCGIRVGWNKLAMYALAGACFGVAGWFQMARIHQGDPTAAGGLELDIIAAVIVGGASLSGGIGTVWGSLAGAFVMSTLRNGIAQRFDHTYLQEIIIGATIVGAVALDRLRTRQR